MKRRTLQKAYRRLYSGAQKYRGNLVVTTFSESADFGFSWVVAPAAAIFPERRQRHPRDSGVL